MSSTSDSAFPVGTRVVLCGLKATEHNGKNGTIESAGPERLHVRLAADGKVMAIRTANLRLEPRPAPSLSVRELKLILEKSGCSENLSGMDRQDLQAAVEACSNPEENAKVLLEHHQRQGQQQRPPAAATTENISAERIRAATEQMNSMDPAQLRQQASMLKSMPPEVLRRQNPMLARMSDDQIRQAAAQFEMMASNPAMMKAATEQMKGLSPEEIERQQESIMKGAGAKDTSNKIDQNAPSASTASPATTAAAAASSSGNMAEMLSSMDPEMIRQQASMMKSMSTSQLRAMGPQFAGMTDEQIHQTTRQMEMIAANPGLMKLAAEQMKNMSPEDIKAVQEGRMPAGLGESSSGGAAAPDPMALLSNTSGKQIKELLQTAKANPDVLRSVMPNADPKQMESMIEKLDRMDESTLDRIIAVLTKLSNFARPVIKMYQSANKIVGGHLLKIVVMLPIVIFLYRWFGPTLFTATVKGTAEEPPEAEEVAALEEFEDEF